MLVNQGLVTAIHDISSGGLAVAVAEMAVQSGVGCSLARVPDIESMFSESPSRAVIAVDPEQMQSVEEIIQNQAIPSARIGLAHGDKFTIKGLIDIELSKIHDQWEGSLQEYLRVEPLKGSSLLLFDIYFQTSQPTQYIAGLVFKSIAFSKCR